MVICHELKKIYAEDCAAMLLTDSCSVLFFFFTNLGGFFLLRISGVALFWVMVHSWEGGKWFFGWALFCRYEHSIVIRGAHSFTRQTALAFSYFVVSIVRVKILTIIKTTGIIFVEVLFAFFWECTKHVSFRYQGFNYILELWVCICGVWIHLRLPVIEPRGILIIASYA